MNPIKHIKLNKSMKVSDLVHQMSHAGFGARKISLANKIAKKMFAEKECKIFLGLAGAMVPAGMKQIIIDSINQKKIHVLVTTGANLTHDLIEALDEEHFHCDTWNDEEFNKKGYDRIYNVLMKNQVYEKLENFFEKNWEEISTPQIKNIRQLIKKIGSILPEKNNSILRTCYENKIPIYCPAIADSGIGLMIWGRLAKGKEINIDAFDDMKEIIDTAWTAKTKGVIYIGGGTPKNFIQQSLQFSSGANYGIQITTDTPAGGGSSGAPLEEGKSWGKLKKDADYIDVNCDATIAMPLIFANIITTQHSPTHPEP
ncbi:deoxyhypusine synthase [Candidatus Pacearchaeota archaeon]|nr:deoxyhypusine synthase [Candidatus Pacearchaeota archaeon]|tara:strand:- start:2686 stop:3627 length:942 start_codon:yes stop_codon:yes gene_type:complete